MCATMVLDGDVPADGRPWQMLEVEVRLEFPAPEDARLRRLILDTAAAGRRPYWLGHDEGLAPGRGLQHPRDRLTVRPAAPADNRVPLAIRPLGRNNMQGRGG
jgi:hypothetical protein